ncbi:MAG: alpha/beta hydrolase [Candidatus Helarchaeota archaeon]|nr:alpha/beta hydrolase [Candidatus Helarchaeota archaeon]
MPIIKCVNQPIRYEKWGNKTSLPPIIFLHGWNNNITGWYKQIPFFSKYTEVYAYDQIGHGKSSRSRDIDYSMDFMAAILYQFIKKLKIKRPVIAGHSMGGMLAQYFALKHPDLISKIILLCTSFGIPRPLKKAPYFLHPIARILAKFFKPIQYFMNSFPHKSLTKKEAHNDFKRAVATDPYGSFKILGAIVSLSMKNEVAKIKNDILFITGTYDIFTNQIPFYHKLGATVKLIKNGEHNLHGHFYKQVNKIMYEFIKS